MRPIFAAGVLTLFLATSSLAAAQTHETKPFTINVMLCDTPERAIAYAMALDGGAAEDEAKDALGRAAGLEVCDKFMGLATVSEQRTLQEKGVTYKVTALHFDGVKTMKWMAQPLN
jgi:hypothetical protein